jgi:hypothetical protein
MVMAQTPEQKAATAKRRAAQKRNARAQAKGKSVIGDIGKAVRSSVKPTRNGPKATEKDHLRSDEFSGAKHVSSSSYSSAKKNVSARSDTPSTGRHSKEAGYIGKHRAPEHDHDKDLAGVIKNGGYSYGKHSAEYRKMTMKTARSRGPFEA